MKIELTIRGLLSVFFRQRTKSISVFLVIMLVTLGYLAVAKTEYEAQGSLLVKFGRSPASTVQPTENAPDVISQNDRRETLESNIEILESHNLLLGVVHEFGAENLYPGVTERAAGKDWPDEIAVRQLWNGDLWVKAGAQSDLIEVRLQNENPVLAAQFVHRLLEVFLARQSEVYNKPQTTFLREQVKMAKARLDQSQQVLQDFREKNGISSIDDELAVLQRQKADASDVALQTTDDAWANLQDLQAKEAQMLQTYRADSPQVAQMHKSVVLAEQQLHTRQSDISVRTGSASSKIDLRIAKLEGLRKQYEDLARQVDIDAQNYKNYQLRSEDARVNETLNEKNITPVTIIDEPVVPKRPVRPRRLIILSVGLLCALLLSTITAVIFETMDPRFTTPRQLALTLGIPVMATFDYKERKA